MIKVLQHGVMKITCPNCKAKLQYEQEDIVAEKRPGGKQYIRCPDCNTEIILNNKKVANDCIDIDSLSL